MKKIRRFAVLLVTFSASEKITIPSAFHGLKELGIEVARIQWKSENRLKIKVMLDPPGQKPTISREIAVSMAVNQARGYFKSATVVATFGRDDH